MFLPETIQSAKFFAHKGEKTAHFGRCHTWPCHPLPICLINLQLSHFTTNTTHTPSPAHHTHIHTRVTRAIFYVTYCCMSSAGLQSCDDSALHRKYCDCSVCVCDLELYSFHTLLATRFLNSTTAAFTGCKPSSIGGVLSWQTERALQRRSNSHCTSRHNHKAKPK
jgi:hypothetical protein